MEDLDDVIDRVCNLKGNMLAIEAMLAALIRVLPAEALAALRAEFEAQREIATTTLLNSARAGDLTAAALDFHAQRVSSSIPR